MGNQYDDALKKLKKVVSAVTTTFNPPAKTAGKPIKGKPRAAKKSKKGK